MIFGNLVDKIRSAAAAAERGNKLTFVAVVPLDVHNGVDSRLAEAVSTVEASTKYLLDKMIASATVKGEPQMVLLFRLGQ